MRLLRYLIKDSCYACYNINMNEKEDNKKKIVDIFLKNVYGKKPFVEDANAAYDGKYGHWLETQMGIKHNGDNEPDLLGYEMKNETTSKTTFGDWSPDEKIFGKNRELERGDFIKIFGHPSKEKAERWSWSGAPVPKICRWNEYGQTLEISPSNDIQVIYDYYNDKRADKDKIVPQKFKSGKHVLMQWSSGVMKEKVENKFNQFGWFKCLLGQDGTYKKIVFGAPITFESWLQAVKRGDIFLDSGMYHDENKPNDRPYMQWRANNSKWTEAIIDEYPKQ